MTEVVPSGSTIPKIKKPKLDLLAISLSPEKLSAASPSREACVKCALYLKCETPFQAPFVPKGWTGKLLLIGDSDGERKPFSTKAGRLLRRMLLKAGYRDNDTAYFTATRCGDSGSIPTMQQVRGCRPFVLRTIDLLHPQGIVALGGTALRSITNIGANNVTNARGRQLDAPGITVPCFATYAPGAILAGAAQYYDRIIEDLKRPFEPVAAGPTHDTPSGTVIALDTEFSPTEDLLTLGVANKTSAIAMESDLANGVAVLRNASVVVGHSIGFADLRYLADLGALKPEWVTGEKVLDSLLLARMVDENGGKGAYELENLLSSFSTVAPWKKDTVAISKTDATLWPPALRMERCRLDAHASYLVANHFYDKLADKRKLVTYTHRIAAVLDRVALAGAVVDMPRFSDMKESLEKERNRTSDLLNKHAARHGVEEFSPTNDTKLRELLYDKLELPVLNKTKKSKLPAVDQITLKLLNHEISNLLLEYNKVEKLYSVNGEGLEDLIRLCGTIDSEAIGWLPFHINPLGARTGRRSSTRPNSQNWPGSVRGIIRSRYPGGIIADFDYKRLEVVLIAWVAGDEKLLEAFTTGRGYLDVAKDLWGKEIEPDTPEYKATKSVVLGVNYNMQSKKMARELWNRVGVRFSANYEEHERKTDSVRRKYLKLHAPLVAYSYARKQELLRDQGVASLVGRVRHLPLPDGEETEGFHRFWNQAINFPIQSLASEVTGSALMDIEAEILRLHGLTYVQYYQMLLEQRKYFLSNPPVDQFKAPVEIPFLINEVHDSIVLDIPLTQLATVKELVVETMRSVPSLHRLCPAFTAPLDCDWKIGPRWGSKEFN